MKYIMTLNVSCDDLFDAYVNNLIDDYFAAKGKLLKKEKIIQGFTYEKNISKDKRKKQAQYATVKVLKIDRPSVYKTEYISNRYHRIMGLEMRPISENKTELVYEIVQDIYNNSDRDSNNISVDIPFSDKIKKASLWKKYQFNYLCKSIRLRKKYLKEKQEKEVLNNA